MPFKAAKCPNCAGDIQVPDERDTAKCMYCGSDIIVREAIKLSVPEVNLDNISKLADEAINSGNYAEAYNFYTKILEVAPENYNAWYGKAISAGWQSTLANIRLPETISGIENAMKYVPEDDKDELKVKAAASLKQLASAIFILVEQNHTSDSSSYTHSQYFPRMRLIITALEIASSYKPDNAPILEDIIFVLQTSGLTKIPNLSDHNDMINKFQEVEKKLQQLDPAYVPEYRATEDKPLPAPPITNKKACFIATAAYGSDMEPAVVTLRQFRDYYLTTDILGNAFIKTYYHLSPPLAELISKNEGLKALTRFLLKPLIYLIKRLQ